MLLIQKANELKCMNRIAKEEEKNFEITSILFHTRMIRLENIFIEVQQPETMEGLTTFVFLF